jgi:hypothetical protein
VSTTPQQPPLAASYAGRMADDTDKRPALVFDDPLSQPSRDDTDQGWGGDGSGDSGNSERDEAWYRRETPPHHGG